MALFRELFERPSYECKTYLAKANGQKTSQLLSVLSRKPSDRVVKRLSQILVLSFKELKYLIIRMQNDQNTIFRKLRISLILRKCSFYNLHLFIGFQLQEAVQSLNF